MNKITKFEYSSVLYLISRSLFLGLGTVRIINNVGADSWISIILGIIIGLLINYLLSKFSNKENIFFKTIISFILLVLGCIILTKGVCAVYLDKTPVFLVIIPILFLIYYLNTKEENTIYRVSSIILIINIILILVAFSSLIPKINIDNFLPLYTHSISKIIISSFEFALLTTIPYTLLSGFNQKYSPKSYLSSCITLLIIFLIIIGVLGYDVASLYSYPEYMVFKRISLLGFIDNIENLLFIMWVLEIFVLMSISSINIKKNTNNKVFILILLFVFIISIILLVINTKLLSIVNAYLFYIILGLFIIYILSKVLIKD